MHEEHTFIPSELPPPAPSYCTNKSVPLTSSPATPSVSRPRPSFQPRSPSSISVSSSEALTGRETPEGLNPLCDTVLGGPITADPESIIGIPEVSGENVATSPANRRRLCLSPSPIFFFMEGDRSRYARRPMYVTNL